MTRFIDPSDESRLRDVLRKVTYRPDWFFSIEDGTLVIQAIVIDTDDHKKRIQLSFGMSLPSFVHPNFDWTDWLFHQIMTVERHEAQEFFKIDGVKVYDPHG